MRRKSLVENILETAFKNPVFGIVISIFFVGLGFYLTGKQAPPTAKPSDVMFIPTMHMLGKVSFIFSTVVLIATGIGYAVFSAKKKQQTAFFETRSTLDDLKNLSWKEFEEYVGSLFEKMGYSVCMGCRCNYQFFVIPKPVQPTTDNGLRCLFRRLN